MSGPIQKKNIKVLIVDDSPVMQDLMKYIIDSDPQLRVVAVASDGEEALEATLKYRPDVITMDLTMPKMDGIEATMHIMETCATPIVIVTGSNSAVDMSHSVRMIQVGALAVQMKPPGIGHPNHEEEAEKLIRTLKLMSEIKVVTRVRNKKVSKLHRDSDRLYKAMTINPSKFDVVAIGVSTGGPPLLQKVIAALPENLSVPILVVQHIAPHFLAGFVDWLQKSCHLPVHIAMQGERLQAGHVYLAPDSYHMEVNVHKRIRLVDKEPQNGHKPSVSMLFRSVAETYGNRAIGIILTGMGKDGAAELKMMRDHGAITIAQNKESCAVFGMPGEAVKLNGATYIFSPEEIIEFLSKLTT